MVKPLLGNRLAPITFTCAFLENALDDTVKAYAGWHKKLGNRVRKSNVAGDLGDMLLRLAPLANPQDKYLFVETVSGWTALFVNGAGGADVSSPGGYLCELCNCRGIAVQCIPDRSLPGHPAGLQIYGAVIFRCFGPEPTGVSIVRNVERVVSAMNDGGTWRFVTEGPVQPYEELEAYARRRVVDRFTPDMLERYCQARGIDFFNPAFYGTRGTVFHHRYSRVPHLMTLEEAQSRLFLDPLA